MNLTHHHQTTVPPIARYLAVCTGCGEARTLSPVTGDEAQLFLNNHAHCHSVVTMRALWLIHQAMAA
jgi:hypothetical protein